MQMRFDKAAMGAIVMALALAACSDDAVETSASGASGGAQDLSPEAVAAADEFLWLEEIDGERAMAWVEEQNERTLGILTADPRYEEMKTEALGVLTAQDRIATPRFRAGGIDNFWQDETNVRGLWRHTSLDSYRSNAPAWETVLDIDALAEAEGANWIWKGAQCLAPEETRCLVNLSDGGKDAVVVREFDAAAGEFVDGGFELPEGKHSVTWLDAETILVATDWGDGSLTESGYPYIVKSLKRGQSLLDAQEVFRGDAGDGGYGVDPIVMRDGGGDVLAVLFNRPLDTFRAEVWEWFEGEPVKLNLPERVSLHGAMELGTPWLVFTNEQEWEAWGQIVRGGALLAAPTSALRSDDRSAPMMADRQVFGPGALQSIDEVAVFDDRIVATVLDNVRSRTIVFGRDEVGGWSSAELPVPEIAAAHLGSTSRGTGRMFYSYEGFLTPPTLALAQGLVGETLWSDISIVREAPAQFDASTHVVLQHSTASADGTQIPYFVVRPKDAPMDGSTPTMMFGYGGFQISYPPVYKPELGKLWLERGGAYVIANIRGGGEFGPAWHQAALKENRQRAFDDFAAVAANLAARGIASADKLAIYGRSNGGVLTSVTLTQHPELIGGAVIESPLVDMLRYQELPPGASWIGEYGDPRIPEEAQFIAAYSGYQNIDPDADYPEVYITTNTRDDRVHPGHARKFAARLQEMGHPALYYENTEGGHSNDSDPILNAERWARHYVYLARQLMD